MIKTFFVEIQALRALAVISVFLFHLNIIFFEGGFLGVDIFFAITGYLITKSIFENNEPILNFYLKRIKRVLPALIILILISYIFVTLFFHPVHSNHFYNSLYYTSVFLSNFYFWIASQDYFNIESYHQPLLHTWSVSLEVQFYLTFPLIVIFLKKFNNSKKLFFLAFFLLISLFLAYLFIGREQSFYMLPYRFCEFMCGSICFFLKKNRNEKLNDFISIVALALLIICILTFTNSNFPGVKGFLVSFLTSLIIYFNNGKLFKSLCNSFLVQKIGLISYSLFLYHWPIIVFYKYLTLHEITTLDYIIIILISLTTSLISYEFVERKFNKIDINNFINKIKYYLVLLFILIFSTIFFKDYYLKYNFFLNDEKIQLLKILDKKASDRVELLKKRPQKLIANSYDHIIVFGDSHASDIYLGLTQIKNNKNFYYMPNNINCFEILSKGDDLHFFEKFTSKVFNKKSTSKFEYMKCYDDFKNLKDLINEIGKNKKIKIILSMMWDKDEIKNLPYFFERMNIYYTDITVISKRISLPKYYMTILRSKSVEQANKIFNQNLKRFKNLNEKLKIIVLQNNAKYLDLNKFICPESNINCTFLLNNNINYIDHTHFTLEFSNKLMKKFKIY